MSKIFIGTASWTDKTLIQCGCFDPPTVKTPERWLKFYASQFPLVEVDSSYYAIPAERTAQQRVERTPSTFVTPHPAPTAPKALPKYVAQSLPVDEQNVYYEDLPGELVDAVWKTFMAAVRPRTMAASLASCSFNFRRGSCLTENTRNSESRKSPREECLLYDIARYLVDV